MKPGLLFSIGIALLAAGELAPTSLEPLGTLSQVGAVAILGYITIYVVTRLLPRQRDEYIRALERMQKAQAEEATQFRLLLTRMLVEGRGVADEDDGEGE